jgi:hypothetical protein
MKVFNKSLKTVAKSKYLGMAVTNQNFIHEEIRRLNSGNAAMNRTNESRD